MFDKYSSTSVSITHHLLLRCDRIKTGKYCLNKLNTNTLPYTDQLQGEIRDRQQPSGKDNKVSREEIDDGLIGDYDISRDNENSDENEEDGSVIDNLNHDNDSKNDMSTREDLHDADEGVESVSSQHSVVQHEDTDDNDVYSPVIPDHDSVKHRRFASNRRRDLPKRPTDNVTVNASDKQTSDKDNHTNANNKSSPLTSKHNKENNDIQTKPHDTVVSEVQSDKNPSVDQMNSSGSHIISDGEDGKSFINPKSNDSSLVDESSDVNEVHMTTASASGVPLTTEQQIGDTCSNKQGSNLPIVVNHSGNESNNIQIKHTEMNHPNNYNDIPNNQVPSKGNNIGSTDQNSDPVHSGNASATPDNRPAYDQPITPKINDQRNTLVYNSPHPHSTASGQGLHIQDDHPQPDQNHIYQSGKEGMQYEHKINQSGQQEIESYQQGMQLDQTNLKSVLDKQDMQYNKQGIYVGQPGNQHNQQVKSSPPDMLHSGPRDRSTNQSHLSSGPPPYVQSGMTNFDHPMIKFGHPSMQSGEPYMQSGHPSMQSSYPNMQYGQSNLQLSHPNNESGHQNMPLGQQGHNQHVNNNYPPHGRTDYMRQCTNPAVHGPLCQSPKMDLRDTPHVVNNYSPQTNNNRGSPFAQYNHNIHSPGSVNSPGGFTPPLRRMSSGESTSSHREHRYHSPVSEMVAHHHQPSQFQPIRRPQAIYSDDNMVGEHSSPNMVSSHAYANQSPHTHMSPYNSVMQNTSPSYTQNNAYENKPQRNEDSAHDITSSPSIDGQHMTRRSNHASHSQPQPEGITGSHSYLEDCRDIARHDYMNSVSTTDHEGTQKEENWDEFVDSVFDDGFSEDLQKRNPAFNRRSMRRSNSRSSSGKLKPITENVSRWMNYYSKANHVHMRCKRLAVRWYG